MGRAKKSVEVEAQVIARGSVTIAMPNNTISVMKDAPSRVE